MLLTVAGSDYAVAKIVFGRNVNGFLLTSCLPTLISDLVQQQLSQKKLFWKKHCMYQFPNMNIILYHICNLKGWSGQIRFTWELEMHLFGHQFLKLKIFHLINKWLSNTQFTQRMACKCSSWILIHTAWDKKNARKTHISFLAPKGSRLRVV